MAQNYEIDIKRFNGQDYDTLLPTPAAHASTHQADGSDPITLQAGNYGALSIPTAAYQNSSVTKPKLASGATYTQIKITLTVAGWSDNSQTVTASGVTANNAVVVSPTPNSYLSYGEFGVYCSAQATNELTFVCDSVPDVDLTVNVLMPV